MKLPNIKKKLAGYWGNSSVRLKFFLVFFFGITAPVLLSNYISFLKYSVQIETLIVDSGFATVHTQARNIQSNLDYYKKILIPFGGSAPIKGYNFALSQEGTEKVPWLGLTINEWEKSIDELFVSTATVDNSYSQLRYIDRAGYEISRVDNTNDNLRVVANEDLQYKGDRYYFTEGRNVPEGTVYISSMDLNREGTPPQIATPAFPNIRFVTPVISTTTSGEFYGVVAANVHRDEIFKSLGHKGLFGKKNTHKYVIDNMGFFLKHPDSSMEFGGPNDLNNGINIKDEFPRIADKLLSGESGSQAYNGSLIAYAPIFPYGDSERFWVVIEEIPKDAAMHSVESLKNSLYVMLFGFIGVLGVVFFILADIAKYSIEESEEFIESIAKIK